MSLRTAAGGGDEFARAADALCDWVLSVAVSEFVVDVHREAKLGLLFLSVPDKQAEKRYALHDRAGVDVFGRSIGELTKQSRCEQCLCPRCGRLIGANRCAPHLAKCMGMGRTRTRNSARRSTQTASSANAGSRASSNERWSPGPASMLAAAAAGRANRSPLSDDELSESESKASSYCDTNQDESDDDWSEQNFKLRAPAQAGGSKTAAGARPIHGRHGVAKRHANKVPRRKHSAGMTKSQSAHAGLWGLNQSARPDRGWTVPGLQMETGDDDDWSRTPSPRITTAASSKQKARAGRPHPPPSHPPPRRTKASVSLEPVPNRPPSSNGGEDSRGYNSMGAQPPAAQLAVDFDRILDEVNEEED